MIWRVFRPGLSVALMSMALSATGCMSERQRKHWDLRAWIYKINDGFGDRRPLFSDKDYYTIMAEDFADALINNRPPRFPAQDGVRNMQVIDRLLEKGFGRGLTLNHALDFRSSVHQLVDAHPTAVAGVGTPFAPHRLVNRKLR